MDFLRSCSTQRLQYILNDATAVVDATWYRAAKGAIAFPGVHAFGSPVWDLVHPTPTTLGFDATAPRRYYNGRRLNSSDGKKVAGPLSYFLDGAPFKQVLPRGADGTPIQCLPAPWGKSTGGLLVPAVSAIGGKKTGGFLVSTGPTPGTPCGQCTGTTPLNVTIAVAGATGTEALFNGSFITTQISACTWTHTISPGIGFTLSRIAIATWSLTIFDFFTGISAFYVLATSECLLPHSLPYNFGPRGGLPASVTLTPGP